MIQPSTGAGSRPLLSECPMYLVRAKGRGLKVRDGRGMTAPSRSVGPIEWVPFDHLPLGFVGAGEDGDLVVREVLDLAKFGEPVAKREPEPVVETPPPPAEPEPVAEVETRRARRPR